MTRDEAKAVAATFDGIGGFSRVEIEEVGWDSGNYRVNLWCVNAKAGNRNLHMVEHVPSEKESVLIAKMAKGKANKRDCEAFNRMKAEREINRE